jgi:osmotically-inducible protein OsmY
LAQQSKGAGETISEKVGDVVEGIKRGARATSESVQAEYQKARASVHDMGVHARVYSRLHWDKELYNSKLELEFKEGTVTLHGAVKSLVAKAKATELARDTVGVDRVDDHLTIEPASPVVEPRPAAKTKS